MTEASGKRRVAYVMREIRKLSQNLAANKTRRSVTRCDIGETPTPRNVTVTRNGDTVPLDCQYLGTTPDGIAVWFTGGYNVDPLTDHLGIDELPEQCAVLIARIKPDGSTDER